VSRGKAIVVVLPAYRAEATLEKTYRQHSHGIVDRVFVVDDATGDATRPLGA